ncbi:MAG: efflux transporter outer membrane subunit [Methylomonas sp.]|nr:efflux transporter outer membrane subunit [Methylomonas sp.]
MRSSALWVFVVSGCFLTGCMLGPDYRTPDTPLPATWRGAAAGAEREELATWWRIFNDPLLADLIEQARTGNRDVYQAQARLLEARFRSALAGANLLPTSSMTMSASQTGSSKAAGISAGTTGIGNTNELFRHAVDASWELDLFGKLRRGLEAAEATEQAAQEDLRDVLVSLCAEVALNYVDLRKQQNQLAITETNLLAQQETYDITRWRRMAGLTTQLDVDQAGLTLENTRASLPSLRGSVAQAQHNLALLLGRQPTDLLTVLSASAPIPQAAATVAVGIPADILRQRPDVRRAERKLAAQTAQVGAAEAERYPSFTLSGSIGVESLAYANLYTAAAKAFQMAAKSALVLLDFGRISANVGIQNALTEQALGLYEASLLTALKEVENALTAYTREAERRAALNAAVEAGRGAMSLSKTQYNAGISDFQRVLEAQRSLLSAELQLTASDAEVASNVIRLYKALGGGWAAENSREKTEHD